MRAYGQISLSSISNGDSPLNIILSNEFQAIPCNNEGLTILDMYIDIFFEGYEGLKKIPCTISKEKISGLVTGMSIINIQNSSESQQGLIRVRVEKGTLLENQLFGNIFFNFTIKGLEIKKTFSWSKSKEGQKGDVGTASRIFFLETSSLVVKRNQKNEFTPNKLIFKSYYKDGDQTQKYPYSGFFTITETLEGGSAIGTYTSQTLENQIEYIIKKENIAKIKSLQCDFYKDKEHLNKLDTQTIIILADYEDISKDLTEIKTSIKKNAENITLSATKKEVFEIQNTVQSSIKSVDIEYAQNSSSTSAPETGWDTLAPTWTDGKFIWTRTTTTFNNGNTISTDPVCITGAKGDTGIDGINGKDGTSITVKSVQYQAGTSATVAPTGNWSNNPISVGQGQYLWTKTLFSDGNFVYGIARQGMNGTDGTSVTVKSIQYQSGTSATIIPNGAWSNDPVTAEEQGYLWTKTTFSDNSVAYGIAKQGLDGKDGNNGSDGKDGRGIVQISEQYCSHTSDKEKPANEAIWIDGAPTIEKNKYIWTRNKIIFDDGKIEYSEPVCSSEWQAIENVTEKVNNVSLELTNEKLNIRVQEQIKQATGGSIVSDETNTDFAFHGAGMTISKTGQPLTTTITHNGMVVQRNGNDVLVANEKGVQATDLHADTFLYIGSNAQFQDYGNGRTACFWYGNMKEV